MRGTLFFLSHLWSQDHAVVFTDHFMIIDPFSHQLSKGLWGRIQWTTGPFIISFSEGLGKWNTKMSPWILTILLKYALLHLRVFPCHPACVCNQFPDDLTDAMHTGHNVKLKLLRKRQCFSWAYRKWWKTPWDTCKAFGKGNLDQGISKQDERGKDVTAVDTSQERPWEGWCSCHM
jgi:hypothetical protein